MGKIINFLHDPTLKDLEAFKCIFKYCPLKLNYTTTNICCFIKIVKNGDIPFSNFKIADKTTRN